MKIPSNWDSLLFQVSIVWRTNIKLLACDLESLLPELLGHTHTH